VTTRVEVKIRIIPGAMDRVARSPEVRDRIQEIVDSLAEGLRRAVPVRTGAGRRSIKGRVVMGPNGWIGGASWDEAHYYLGILDSRHHFAEPVMNRVRHV
jgi:hypothetical protein